MSKYLNDYYWMDDEFGEKEDSKKAGLDFSKANRDGLVVYLDELFDGREVQYVENGEVILVELYPFGQYEHGHWDKIVFDFSGRSLWKRIFSQKIQDRPDVDVITRDLMHMIEAP